MKKREKKPVLAGILMPLVAIALLLCFLSGISNVTRGRSAEDKQRLEDVLRRAAVACYAAEGRYPESLEHLVEHYGVQIDSRNFIVSYMPIAENLMPDITVLEK